MNLVVGATGYLGTEICRRLVEVGESVRGLVRATSAPGKVSYLQSLGVEAVVGDLKDRASLDAACAGVEAVISTATITASRQPDDTVQNVDQAGQINLVDAAQAAGVERFIYISYSANLDTDSPLTTAKRTVEQHLMQSGLNYTILRPSYFMEVWISPVVGFDYAGGKTTIYGEGTNKLAWISRADVAAFAAAVLHSRIAHNAVFELGGPENLSPLEVVRIFEEAAGQTFEVQHVPVEALRAQKANAVDSVEQSFCALMLDYAEGDPIDMRQTLKSFPMALTSVKDYASRVMAATRE